MAAAGLTISSMLEEADGRVLAVLLCGAGRRGLEHIELLDGVPGLHLAGVHDISSAHLERAAKHTAAPTSKDLDAILDNADPRIVVLATPPNARSSLVDRISGHPGVRAIIVEKPFALSLADADRMLGRCAERGIQLGVFHQLPFCREFLRLQRAIQSGELGALKSLHAFCYGNLFDQGSHMADLLRWLLPERKAEWVAAQGWTDLPTLARFAELPPSFGGTGMHPGSPWTHATVGFSGDFQATLSCGLLSPTTEPRLGPWLQKRVVAIGSDGLAEAHSASHFRMLTSRTSGWVTETSDLDSYRDAQRQYYATLRDHLAADEPWLHPATAQRESLEIVVACQESERRAQAVTLPLANATPVSSPDSSMRLRPGQASTHPRLRVSVLLPMADHRGIGVQSVASWTETQRCDPDAFELIVVTDSRTADLEERICRLLRSQDRLIRQDGNDMVQYDRAARAGRGDILFLTEPHCLAEPEAVAQIIDYMDTHEVDGFCARSTPFCVGNMGRSESVMFDKGFEQWSRPESWVKVIVRGFGIRKEAYAAVGGLEHHYDRFAEWLLAARLRVAGYQMGYAPGVGVHHRYGDTFALYSESIQQFTNGECQFRQECESPRFVQTFFGDPPEWAAARSVRNRPTPRLAGALRRLQRQSDPATSVMHTNALDLAGALAHGMLAARRLLLKHQVAVWTAQARYWLSLTQHQRFRAFEDYYMAETSLCRVRFALQSPSNSGIQVDYALQAVDDGDLYGFYGREDFDGCPFRWSGPVSAVRLRLEPADYLGTIQLVGVRAIDPCRDVAVFLDECRVADVSFDQSGWRLTFPVPAAALEGRPAPWLVLHATAWCHPDLAATETRQLGLPVASLSFSPA